MDFLIVRQEIINVSQIVFIEKYVDGGYIELTTKRKIELNEKEFTNVLKELGIDTQADWFGYKVWRIKS